MNSPKLEWIRNARQWTVIALFIGLLWLPTLDSFVHWDNAPIPNENRAPAKFPVFNGKIDGIREFVSGLESYYNDHFGFRRRLIRWNNHWKHELFKESTLPNVITGRDGWLYYSGDGMVENCLGISKFEPEELRQWQSLLEGRRDWLARRGIRYLFVIPPNKESVYPEFLPEWIVPERPTTRLDQFFAYMKTNSTVEVLDLRPSLREARQTNLVYMKTDTHWNATGAFIGHQDLIRALSRQLPSLDPLPWSAFEKASSARIGGDLARMLGQEQAMPEKEFPAFTPRPPLQPPVETTNANLLSDKKWERFIPVITENTNRSGTAILFRDSFAGRWVPFIGLYFGKVIYLFQENWAPDFIEKTKPTVVIDEMVERYFYTANPAKLQIDDNLK